MSAVNGWTIFVHECLAGQLQRLEKATMRAQKADPQNAANNPNVKLFQTVSALMLNIIPQNPGHQRFRQGSTLGKEYVHWRRAKIGRRFRLFFRFDSTSKIIIYAWLNDVNTLRSAGSGTDPYAVFQKMLNHGNPPDDWEVLLNSVR